MNMRSKTVTTAERCSGSACWRCSPRRCRSRSAPALRGRSRRRCSIRPSPLHSGEMIAAALGNAFLGFALSLLVISPLLDVIGAKRVILFASACFIVGPVLILLSPSMGGIDAVYRDADRRHGRLRLRLGRDRGFDQSGDGGALSRRQDQASSTSLHAWWPAGIVVGGLASLLFFQQLDLGWQALIALIPIPGVIFGALGADPGLPQDREHRDGRAVQGDDRRAVQAARASGSSRRSCSSPPRPSSRRARGSTSR